VGHYRRRPEGYSGCAEGDVEERESGAGVRPAWRRPGAGRTTSFPPAEGPVGAINDDGVTSAVKLPFGTGLYYTGKTLSNEDNSALYKLNGVKASRGCISKQAHPVVDRDRLTREFVDREGDGTARFLIYDYGPGDTLTVPSLISIDNTGK